MSWCVRPLRAARRGPLSASPPPRAACGRTQLGDATRCDARTVADCCGLATSAPLAPDPPQGHVKTVIVLAGGYLLFADAMPPKKLLGITISMAGIVW